MVSTAYIVYCKLNKSTDKFDLGVYATPQKAKEIKEQYQEILQTFIKIWVRPYKLTILPEFMEHKNEYDY